MATALGSNPAQMVRDAEQNLGTAAAPVGSSQLTVASTVYSFVPKKAGRIVFLIAATNAGTFTLKAGAYPPALESGQGDYTTAALTAGNFYAITVDPSRHMQADGSIQFSTSAVMTVWPLMASA